MPQSDMQPRTLTEAVRLFNEGQFFEAHEVLEDLWRAAPTAHKKFLQGLTQLAVAFHHHSTGNLIGCRSVMARALRNLSTYPDGLLSLRTPEILQAVTPCQRALDKNQSLAALPKLKIHHEEPHAD